VICPWRGGRIGEERTPARSPKIGRGCGLLAYSQRRSLLDALRAHESGIPDASRADLLAAIDALEQGNHHLFVDREHTGKVTWNIVKN
jgi:hypothetical protein